MDKSYEYYEEAKGENYLTWFFGVTSVIILGTWWATLAIGVLWLWQ